MYLEMKSFFYSSCYGKLTEGQKQLVQHAFDKFEKAYNTTKNTDLAITCTNSMITAAGIAATCSGAGAPVGLALSLGGTVVGYVSGCINEQVRKNFIKTSAPMPTRKMTMTARGTTIIRTARAAALPSTLTPPASSMTE